MSTFAPCYAQTCGDRSIPIVVKFCLENMYDWATVGDFS